MNKYNAKKVIVTADGTLFDLETLKRFNLDIQGERFDSTAEGEYFQQLLLLKKDGAISEINCHPVYVLQDKPKITYIADFLVTFTDGQQVVIDVKGVLTSTFSLKQRLFRAKFPDLELRLIIKYQGRWVPLQELRKARSDHKRAINKLIKQAEQKGRTNNERQQKP